MGVINPIVSSVAGKDGDVSLTGTDISNTPAGNIVATNIQTAINELDTEKAKLDGGNTFTGDQVVTSSTSSVNIKIQSTVGNQVSFLDLKNNINEYLEHGIYGLGSSGTIFGESTASAAFSIIAASKYLIGSFGASPIVFGTNSTARAKIESTGELNLLNNDITNVLTGLVTSNTVIAVTDSVRTAIGKAQGQISAISTTVSTKADKTTTISAGTSLNGGGDLSANRTINHNSFGTAGTYGSASNVPVITTEATGHITSVTNTPIQIAQSQVTNLTTDLAGKANLAGGNTFTGSQRVEGATFTLYNGSNPQFVIAASGGAGNSPSLEFKPFEGRTGGSSSRIVSVDNNFSSDLAFYNATTGNGANIAIERMRLGANGQLSIGTATPNAAAILQIDSTTQGFLMPRMTSAQRLAIATPANGLQVYDTDLGEVCTYEGTYWSYIVEQVITTVQSSTSTTHANITQSTTPSLEAGSYVWDVRGIYQSTSTIAGIGFRLNSTGTISNVFGQWNIKSTAQTSTGIDDTQNYDQYTNAITNNTTTVNAANTNFTFFGKGVLQTTTSGAASVQFKSSSTTSVSVRPGCVLTIRKVA